MKETDVETNRRVMMEEMDSISPPPQKRRKSFFEDSSICESVNTLIGEMGHVKSEIKKLRKLAFRHHFSYSFLAALEETFSCSIFKLVPPKAPLIGCRQCNTLIVCQDCTDRWYGGNMTKRCPKCRCERGLSQTFTLKGFDTLTEQITELNKNTSSTEDEDSDASNDTLPISILEVDD